MPVSRRSIAILIFLALIGSLVTYKTSGSLATLAKAEAARTLKPRADALPTQELSPPTRAQLLGGMLPAQSAGCVHSTVRLSFTLIVFPARLRRGWQDNG